MQNSTRSCDACSSSIFSQLVSARDSNSVPGKTTRQFPSERVLYDEGAASAFVYCLHKGFVKLFKLGANEGEVIVRLAGPKDIFGYLSCIDEDNHSVTAQTLTEVTACMIPSRVFRALMKTNPQVWEPMTRKIIRDLRHAREEIVFRTHMSATCRIARLLKSFLDHAAGDLTLSIPVKRLEMAQLIGTTPETISRVLRGLHDEGIVCLDNQQISVKHQARLDELAQLPGTL
jgi:CRP/FNR family transcriptional regulator